MCNVYVCVYVCMHIYICIYNYIYVYVYIMIWMYNNLYIFFGRLLGALDTAIYYCYLLLNFTGGA